MTGLPADQPRPCSCTARRSLLQGAAAVVAGTALTACASSSEEPADGKKKSETPAGKGSSEMVELGKASEVPVGGGAVYPDQKIVVVQPAEGEFIAYTGICTHAGCTVTKVEKGEIICPCHMSRFSIKDGSVQGGPADAPLAELELEQDGGTLRAAPPQG